MITSFLLVPLYFSVWDHIFRRISSEKILENITRSELGKIRLKNIGQEQFNRYFGREQDLFIQTCVGYIYLNQF